MMTDQEKLNYCQDTYKEGDIIQVAHMYDKDIKIKNYHTIVPTNPTFVFQGNDILMKSSNNLLFSSSGYVACVYYDFNSRFSRVIVNNDLEEIRKWLYEN